MATRAQRAIDKNGLIRKYTVAAAQATTAGCAVAFAAADDQIQTSSAAGAAFGIALETKAAGEQCDVLLLGFAIAKVKVAVGGTATRGVYAQTLTATGAFTNKVLGGGTVVQPIQGIFLESGVAGDLVALLITGAFNGVSA